MSENLTPEEVDALHEDDGPAKDPVEPRDFRHPHRWGQLHREALGRRVMAARKELLARLRPWSPETLNVELQAVEEIDAPAVTAGLEEPFITLGFEVAGAPGWVVWSRDAALASFEALFGSGDDEEAESEDESEEGASGLSPVQVALLRDMLGEIATFFAQLFELHAEGFALHQGFTTLLSTLPVGAEQDAQRTVFRLDLETAGGAGELKVFLPGLHPEELSAPAVDELPERLDRLPLEVRAVLADVDVPLGELLEVAVGDVIPLRIRAGSPLTVLVQDRACGKAHWGSSEGSSAVKLQEFQVPTEEQ